MDDLEWDEWLKLTDEQQQAILDREMAALARRIDAMPLPRRIAYERFQALEAIRDSRGALRNPKLVRVAIIDEWWRERIRRNQVRLLKIRAWRSTGVRPGTA